MRRYLAILLVLILVLPLTGCSDEVPPEEPDSPIVTDPTPTPPSPPEDPADDEDEDTELEDDNQEDDGDISEKEPEIIEDRVWAFIKGGDIWTRDVEGKEKKLTHYQDIRDLHWSPDGSQIAFGRAARNRQDDGNYNWQYSIWLMDAAGDNARLVEDSLESRYLVVDGDGYIWSPDSSRLALYKNQQVVILDIATEEKEMIPVTEGYTNGPWWHPGGRYLAFTGDLSEPGIFIIDTETGDSMLLPNTASPLWRENSLVAASYEMKSYFYDSPEEKTYYRNYTGIDVYSLEDFSKTLTISLPEGIREILPVKFMLSSSGRYVATGNSTYLWVADLEEESIAEFGEQDIIDTGSEYWIQYYSLWAPNQDILLSMPFVKTNGDEGILELRLTDMTSGET